MAYEIPVTRRTFLKLVGSSTAIAISIHSLPAMAQCTGSYAQANSLRDPRDDTRLDAGPQWSARPGVARWRIDGLPKVTGQKIYARDFKARDFKWPDEQWLYAVRCNRVDRNFTGIDLSMLDDQPVTIIDDALTSRHKIDTRCYTSSGATEPPLLARKDQPPDFYGQPAALLIFADFDTYRRAKRQLDFNSNVVRYGPPLGTSHRAALGKIPYDETNVRAPELPGDPSKPFNKASLSRDVYNAHVDAVGQQVRRTAETSETEKGWIKVGTDEGGRFDTPSIDPVFLEPESGLAYYDASKGALRLVLGTQSPNDDANNACHLFNNSDITISGVDIIACYPGGGFGGRDKSYFPIYLALAAPFAKGALRWQQSRYEQFQVGLKRCESSFTESLWVSPAGKFEAIDCEFTLSGGRKTNLQAAVASLAAMSAMSCYEIPLARSHGVANFSYDVFGGSQRGFGGPQAFLAIETLIDEAAQRLGKDPFELRKANLLAPGKGATITGAPILFDLQLDQIMEPLRRHPLWQERHRVAAERARGSAGRNKKYGVGFAMSNQAYGSGTTEGMFGMIEILPDATLRVRTTYTDMGNGAATTLSLAPATWLGQNANSIAMSQIDVFNAFQLSSYAKYTDAHYIPGKTYGSSSSCLGAFHQHHAVEEAAHVLHLQAVLPAARIYWSAPTLTPDDIHWVEGRLVPVSKARSKLKANSLHPLTWPMLRSLIERHSLHTIAVVHASYTGAFWRFTFPFQSGACKVDCDFVATGTDIKTLTQLTRAESAAPSSAPTKINSNYGRDTYAPAGALVALEVDTKTGRVHVEKVVAAVNTGVMICPPIVEGQLYGGIAMAIGNVLCENCIPGDDGPGGGGWNLDRYQILRMSDMPDAALIPITAPADKAQHAGRGIGEAVMCPIAPAVLNALAMATGVRFRTTPVTPQRIREALT
ncbi:Xanthine dehydrogenase family protein molybdopterin-binding subunit [Pararobbsia alpina]|uniref:xanthine dehydrogenase family protein molybdopterin-binding subunit n=1 Tax=Pararobbsia alpina TaxID=621374 RepID=UPI0039A5DDBD